MYYQSSLTLALLRAIPTEGNVYYDGLPTSSVNLDSLRANITIIPQSVSRVLHLCSPYRLRA
jgi:ABC-type multidrug transport system fused ATPase/permease subunit